MSRNQKEEKEHLHSADCGCRPTLLIDMIENAARELSRPQFIKDVTAVGGVLAVGGLASSGLARYKTASSDTKADAIYHGGPILIRGGASVTLGLLLSKYYSNRE